MKRIFLKIKVKFQVNDTYHEWKQMMYRWKKNVKWRTEEKSILICDCKTTNFFDLPLQYQDICAELEKRLPKDAFNADLLEDLSALDLIESTSENDFN